MLGSGVIVTARSLGRRQLIGFVAIYLVGRHEDEHRFRRGLSSRVEEI
jgi:hypothetical protein